MKMNHSEVEMFKEEILDYIGKKIKNLEFSSEGKIKIRWDGKDMYYEFSVYPQKGIIEVIEYESV